MEKAKYKEKAKTTVDEVFSKIEQLESKRNQVSDSAKAEYDEQIAALKAKYNELENEYKKLELETGQAWQDTKNKFAESADFFKAGFAKIGEIFDSREKEK